MLDVAFSGRRHRPTHRTRILSPEFPSVNGWFAPIVIAGECATPHQSTGGSLRTMAAAVSGCAGGGPGGHLEVHPVALGVPGVDEGVRGLRVALAGVDG